MSVFSHVDASNDPGAAVDYLDRIAGAQRGMKHYAAAAHAGRSPRGFVLDVGCGAGHDLTLLHDAGHLTVQQSRFAMHVDAAELARWWGPEGFTVPRIAADASVGGRFRIEMRPPDGEPFSLTGEFVEIVRPTRLAYTFVWEPPDADDRETMAELSFDALPDDSTELTVNHGVFATEQRRALHEQGWTETLNRLRVTIETDTASH